MIIDYIYSETKRQHRDNYGDFARAFHVLAATPLAAGENYLHTVVQLVGAGVEPEVNRFQHTGHHYDCFRWSHGGFLSGGTAAPVNEVRQRMERLSLEGCDLIGRTCSANAGGKAIGMTRRECDQFIKSLLDIHPFVDGNGRTASILRNWMLGLMDRPQPLPYYYN